MSKVLLVEVLDPLYTHKRRLSHIDWQEGQTVADVLPWGPKLSTEMAVSLNGMVLEDDALLTAKLRAGDAVVFAPIPAGGGSGKQILRIVAIIAIAVVTQGWGGAAAGSMFAAGTTGYAVASGVISAGIMIAGSMLVNALLPLPKPRTPNAGIDGSSYGVDGAKNTSAEGLPVPVPYGEFRVGGNIIGLYTENVELGQQYQYLDRSATYKVSEQRQWLHMLINLGEGPVFGISGIQINDEPIENFVWRPDGATADVPAYETRFYPGLPDQGPIAWFDKSVTPHSMQAKFLESWTTYSTNDEVDSLRLDLASPTGIFHVENDGDVRDTSFEIEIQIKKQGAADSTYVPFQGHFGNAPTVERIVPRMITVTMTDWSDGNGEPQHSWQQQYEIDGSERRVGNTLVGRNNQVVADIVEEAATTTNGKFKITSRQRNGWRASISSGALAEDKYTIRFKRLTAESTDDRTFNQLFLTDVNEVTNERVNHEHTALLALKILVTDKLSGQPNVTALLKGRTLRVWNEQIGWTQAYNANPAWVALDAMTHPRYGGAMADSRFDLERWKEWAEECDAKGLEFHGTFDTTRTAWDAIQEICRAGRAQLIPIGTRFTIAMERPESPSMVFNVANMIEGSFKLNWLSTAERANEIEVTFQDRDDNYRQATVKAVDSVAVGNGSPQRTSSISLMGLVSKQRAWEEAMLQLNMNRYVLQTCEFSVPGEAIGCAVGDVVTVQHDMPAWSTGGKLAAGSTTTNLVLDRPAKFLFGQSYQALVHFSQVQKATGTIFSKVGNTLVLNGYSGTQSVRRLTANGRDVEVLGFFQASGKWGVEVSDATGIAVGATYQLWNTDELVTVGVANPATSANQEVEVTAVTLTAALPGNPAAFSNWLIGRTQLVGKPFRIKSIGGSDPVNRDIVAIEYNATVYDPAGAAPSPDYSSFDRSVEQARIIAVRETLKRVGNTTVPVVTLSFGPARPRSNYKNAEVLLAKGSDAYQSLGFHSSEVDVQAAVGDLLNFRVIARSMQDKPAVPSGAPEITYRVVGRTTVPGEVTGAAYAFEDAGIRLSWNLPNEVTWQSTSVREEAVNIGGSQSSGSIELGPTVYNQRGTNVLLPFRAARNHTFYLRHHIPGISSNAVSLVVPVRKPATPVVQSGAAQAGSINLRWQQLKTDQPLKDIELRVGPTWATSTVYGTIANTALAHTLVFGSDGSRTIWVRARDVADNWGEPGSVTVVIAGQGSSDTSQPPAPQGLAATSRFGTNTIVWTAPEYTNGGGHGETIVFAAKRVTIAPTITDAKPIGTVRGPSNVFEHNPAPGEVWHYWAAFVTKAGVTGPVGGGANGVAVTTARLTSADMDAAILDVGSFASNIEPVSMVNFNPAAVPSTKPTTKITSLIFNTFDGKLYRWNGTQYTAANNMAAADLEGQILADQIANGAITTEKIAARAITAGQMVLTDLTNLVPNGDFSLGDASGWSTLPAGWGVVPKTFSTSNAYLGCPTTHLCRIVPSAGVSAAFGIPLSTPVSCEAGDKFYISLDAGVTGGPSGYVANTLMFVVRWRDSAGAIIANAAYGFPSLATSWTRRQEVVTAPAGAVGFTLYVQSTSTTNTGEVVFSKLVCRRMAQAKLIVDGDITANKLAAGSVTADKIEADAVIAGKIAAAAINTRELAAGAVTTEKMVVTGSQLVPNSDFQYGITNWRPWAAPASISVVPATNAPTPRVCRFTATGDGSPVAMFTHSLAYNDAGADKDGIEVAAGESYFVSIDAGKAGGTAGGTFDVLVYWHTADGSFTAATMVMNNILPSIPVGAYQRFTGSFTAPADAVRAHLFVRWLSSSAGIVYWTNLRCNRMAGGELIVDGSITAAKVAVGSLTADRIDTRGLDIKDGAGNVIFSASVNLPSSRVGGLGSFASMSQFTAANITTYIAAGAIGTALIGNAAITNAKIGNLAVDTLKIADQSVVIPIGFNYGNQAWQITNAVGTPQSLLAANGPRINLPSVGVGGGVIAHFTVGVRLRFTGIPTTFDTEGNVQGAERNAGYVDISMGRLNGSGGGATLRTWRLEVESDGISSANVSVRDSVAMSVFDQVGAGIYDYYFDIVGVRTAGSRPLQVDLTAPTITLVGARK